MGKEDGSVGSLDVAAAVVLDDVVNPVEELESDVKNEVGRAMSTTPRREIKEAYCAERGKGSWRKT